jgi:hypothetical protein
MSTSKNIDIINGLLEKVSSRHVFNTNHEKMSYELGYLMGLLANLMENDSHVRSTVRSKAKSKPE